MIKRKQGRDMWASLVYMRTSLKGQLSLEVSDYIWMHQGVISLGTLQDLEIKIRQRARG
jgi:hypothetical protein